MWNSIWDAWSVEGCWVLNQLHGLNNHSSSAFVQAKYKEASLQYGKAIRYLNLGVFEDLEPTLSEEQISELSKVKLPNLLNRWHFLLLRSQLLIRSIGIHCMATSQLFSNILSNILKDKPMTNDQAARTIRNAVWCSHIHVCRAYICSTLNVCWIAETFVWR